MAWNHKITIESGQRRVRVGDAMLPRRFELHTVPTDADAPDNKEPEEHFTFEVVGGVPQCREVRIVSSAGGREVRRTDLRDVPIEDVLEYAAVGASTAIREVRSDGTIVSVKTVDADLLDRSLRSVRGARRTGRKSGPTDHELQEAAQIYRDAGRAPTQSVAKHFGIAHRTASLWLKRARDAGLLPASQPGRVSR